MFYVSAGQSGLHNFHQTHFIIYLVKEMEILCIEMSKKVFRANILGYEKQLENVLFIRGQVLERQ